MKIVPTRVDTHIWVDKRNLPSGATWMIKEALSFENEDKHQARREHLNGWQEMPDRITLWRELPGTDKLILPRGFANNYELIISMLDGEVKWDDERVDVWMTEDEELTSISLFDHQTPVVMDTLVAEQGIYEAPPGSGKTVTALEIIRQLNQRAIVLVDKTNIAEQWRERSRSFLNYNPGLIGDGIWEEKDITIALQQTLWSRRRQLDEQGFFDRWGVVIMDECHHVTAETYQQVIQKFPACYRIGISATPERHEWTFPIALAALGPVYSKTTRDELQDKGVLIKPEVRVVHTRFNFAFRSTSVSARGYRRSNNYQQMMSRLIEDEERNNLIVSRILREPESHHLVVSKRLNHLQELARLVEQGAYPHERILMLTGAENRERRLEVSHEAEKAPCVIFSTIADEALDIPRLDRIHLVWPQRNASVVRQQVGRIERVHPKKDSAIAYDYYDGRVGVLKNQFMTRLNDVYKAEGLALFYENTSPS